MQLIISFCGKSAVRGMCLHLIPLTTWDGLLDIMDERSTAADAHLGTCKFVTLSPTKIVKTLQ